MAIIVIERAREWSSSLDHRFVVRAHLALLFTILLASACRDARVRTGASNLPVATSGAAPVPAPSAWYPPGQGQHLELIWTLHSSIYETDGGPNRNLELVVRVGGAVHCVALGVHGGSLFAAEQSACDPSLKSGDQVSVIHFVTMGPETIVARRVRASLLEIYFDRDADDEPAKTHGLLATIGVPADARFSDSIAMIGENGEERVIDCSSRAEEPWGPPRASQR